MNSKSSESISPAEQDGKEFLVSDEESLNRNKFKKRPSDNDDDVEDENRPNESISFGNNEDNANEDTSSQEKPKMKKRRLMKKRLASLDDEEQEELELAQDNLLIESASDAENEEYNDPTEHDGVQSDDDGDNDDVASGLIEVEGNDMAALDNFDTKVSHSSRVDERLLSFDQIKEAQEIFGEGHDDFGDDYDDLEKEGLASDDIAAQKSSFDYIQLLQNFCLVDDERIRNTDIPERFISTGRNWNSFTTDIQDEAQWIAYQMAIKYHSLIAGSNIIVSFIEEYKSIVEAILNLMLVSKHILNLRKLMASVFVKFFCCFISLFLLGGKIRSSLHLVISKRLFAT